MLLELVATVALGMGAAGVVMGLRFISRGRLPGYLIPIGAGAAMLAFAIWGEYSWFSRVKSGLPDDVQVLATFEQRMILKPWTYIIPRTYRFSAVDLGSRRQHEDLPGLNMVEIYLVAHREPTRSLFQIIDCPGRKRAEVDGMLTLGLDGAPTDANWVDFESDDPLMIAVCAG